MRALGPASFAVQHFIYWAVRHAGSMVAAMGGLDAVVFTGGIGENDRVVRKGIAEGLGYLGAVVDGAANAQNDGAIHAAASRVAIWTVPADEERQIALEAAAVKAGEGR
jgi:acetate kinase